MTHNLGFSALYTMRSARQSVLCQTSTSTICLGWLTPSSGSRRPIGVRVEHGTFKAAYERQRLELSRRAVEADVLGFAIANLLAENQSWSGTSTDLLEAVTKRTPTQLRKRLPVTASSLGQELKRLRPDLKTSGIDVDWNREGHKSTRTIHLRLTTTAARAVIADRKSSARGRGRQ